MYRVLNLLKGQNRRFEFLSLVNSPNKINLPSAETCAPVAKMFFLISIDMPHLFESIRFSENESENMGHIDEKSGKISSPLGVLVSAEGRFILWALYFFHCESSDFALRKS